MLTRKNYGSYSKGGVEGAFPTNFCEANKSSRENTTSKTKPAPCKFTKRSLADVREPAAATEKAETAKPNKYSLLRHFQRLSNEESLLQF